MLKRNLAREVLGVAEREVRCLPPGTRGAECAGWCACGRGRVYAGAYECVQTQHMIMAHDGLHRPCVCRSRIKQPPGLRRLANQTAPHRPKAQFVGRAGAAPEPAAPPTAQASILVNFSAGQAGGATGGPPAPGPVPKNPASMFTQ